MLAVNSASIYKRGDMGMLLRVTSNGVLGMERMRRMLSHGIVLPGLKGGHGILGHCGDNAFLAGRGWRGLGLFVSSFSSDIRNAAG